MTKIKAISNSGDDTTIDVIEDTIICPNCHVNIIPKPLYAFVRSNGSSIDLMLRCPNINNCGSVFIGVNQKTISSSGYPTFSSSGPIFKGTVRPRQFSDTIKALSAPFVTIYNQAYTSEQQGLSEICGVGYRKAIEFLIKDFAVLNNPNETDLILKMPLMQCINKFVESGNIKKVAERAVWLGNDQTHYVRLWDNHDLQDLKRLIDLTVHWIEAEELTKEIINNMPRK
ncbi:hypothetical protein GCM10028819_38940 [Spirosoma humi]